MQLFAHPYAAFLHEVEKPNRYTGAEHGARPVPPEAPPGQKSWRSVQARVCLAFPEIYDIGMSHLGYRILYKVLNDDPRTLAERCYAPWIDLQAKLQEHGKLLVSLESARPLSDFDVVGFSLQYELTYSTVLRMLRLGGIPWRAAARGDDDPLIVAGGPVATHAEPMAPFLDAILIGDGEEALTELALVWTAGKRAGQPREARLRALAQLRGVYVPSLYDTAVDERTGLLVVTGPKPGTGAPFPVERRLLEDLSRFPFPDDSPVGGPEAIFDRMSIEVARGCTEGCRFCQAGMIYRPVREREPKEVVDTVLRALAKSGHDEVSLTALSTADVSCISPLIKALVDKTAPERISLSVASLRAYGLAEELLDDLRRVRATGLTFAPEAGTQRLRDVINKNVTEEQLMETAERVFSRGYDKMKLYFICGLPTEEDADVRGIVEVARATLAVGRRLGKRPTVTVSVSVHIPKPHTPFQWCAMDTPEQIAHKQQLLRDAARGVKGLGLRLHNDRSSVLEAVLARGDRRLADVIERATEHGALFDSWTEHLRLEVWEEALRHCQVDTSLYLGTLPVDARLPWDHVDIGLEDGFLAREYRKALHSRLSPPCSKVAGTFVHPTNVQDALAQKARLVCYDCGIACDMRQMRERRVGFLHAMGAERPARAPDPPGGAADAPPGASAQRVDRTEHVRRLEAARGVRSGTASRWRLGFAKVGPTALLGHLDLTRELSRVIRRAGVRIGYSAGFRPKPELSFAPALSLGVASLDEYLDAKLLDAPSAEALLLRLNGAAKGGLSFHAAVALGPRDPGLSSVVTGARYVLAVSESALAALGGAAWLEQRVAAFLATSEHRLLRNVNGLGKWLDARSFVSSLAVDEPAAEAAVRRAGILGRVTCLSAELKILGTGALKPRELLTAVTGLPELPHVTVRWALLAGAGTPLDLELHRQEALGKPKTERDGELLVAP